MRPIITFDEEISIHLMCRLNKENIYPLYILHIEKSCFWAIFPIVFYFNIYKLKNLYNYRYYSVFVHHLFCFWLEKLDKDALA